MTTPTPRSSPPLDKLAVPPAGVRRTRLRAVAAGVISALVIAAAAAYVVAPARTEVALSVRQVSGPQAFDYDASPAYVLTAASHRYTETLYGSVDGKTRIRRPVLRLVGTGAAVRGQRVRIPLKPSGAYRARLHLPPGAYRITITLVAGGRTRAAGTALRLRSGRSYQASVTVNAHGVLTMLPVSGY